MKTKRPENSFIDPCYQKMCLYPFETHLVNAKIPSTNAKSMSKFKCPNEGKIRTALSGSVASCHGRQVNVTYLVMKAFGFYLTFEL